MKNKEEPHSKQVHNMRAIIQSAENYKKVIEELFELEYSIRLMEMSNDDEEEIWDMHLGTYPIKKMLGITKRQLTACKKRIAKMNVMADMDKKLKK